MKKIQVVAVLLALISTSLSAAPVPSKSAPPAVEQRSADLAVINDAVERHDVGEALARHGFTSAEVEHRLSLLTPADLHELAGNVSEIESGGMGRKQWIWIGVGVVVAVLIMYAAAQASLASNL
jgi:hypothetical protein